MQTYAEGRNPTRQKAHDFGSKRANSHLRVQSFCATPVIFCNLLLSLVTDVTQSGPIPGASAAGSSRLLDPQITARSNQCWNDGQNQSDDDYSQHCCTGLLPTDPSNKSD